MRLLIVDPLGNALDLAMRAAQEGHQVKHFIRQTPKTEHIGRGLVEVVDDFKGWLRWADLVFNTDNTKYLRDLDAARRDGVIVVGPSETTAQWELDRSIGMSVFNKHGIATLDAVEFTDYEKAIAFVKKNDRRYVSKPSGIVEDKSLSYVSKSPEDLIYMLTRWKRMKKEQQFILQEFTPGSEMAAGGFFGPGGWSGGWCENFEFKKLMNGDLGVATGEQGTVLRFVERSKLARKVLLPLTDTLSSLNYIGYIDVNCIITDAGDVWPLEFTMRPGWPTFNIQMALNPGDPVTWLKELAEGYAPHPFHQNTVAVGVVLSIPDYPYSHMTRKEVVGVPLYNLTPLLLRHIHPCEMQLATCPCREGETWMDAPMLATAGDYVLVMTASGPTVRETTDTVYRRLERLTIPNSPMWRTDIGTRLAKQLPILQANGYALGLHYSKETAPTSSTSLPRPSMKPKSLSIGTGTTLPTP